MGAIGRTLRRVYWGLCGLALLAGIACAAAAVVFPPEEFDADGHLIAEMPLAFGAGLGLAALGLFGLVLGLMAVGLAWLVRRGQARVARGGRMR